VRQRHFLTWGLAATWLLALLAVVLSLRMIGQPELEARYGPDLIVMGVSNDGWHVVLQPGDSIIAVDGQPVATADEIRHVLRGGTPGARHLVHVDRWGTRLGFPIRAHILTPRDWLGDNLSILLYGLAFLAAATLLVGLQATGPAGEAFVGMACCVGAFAIVGVAHLTAQALWPVTVLLQPLQAMGLVAFGLALRHPGRRIRWPWWLGLVWGLALLPTYTPHGRLGPAGLARFDLHRLWEVVGQCSLVLAAIITLWLLLLQARRHSERFSIHRQQVTVILAGTLVSLMPLCWIWLIAMIMGRQPWPPLAALALIATAIMPVSAAAALLRFRLAALEGLVRMTLVGTLTAGGLAAVYFGVYTLLSGWGDTTKGLATEWQFGLLLGLAVVFEPSARGIGRSLDRFLYDDRWEVTDLLRRIQAYGAATWSQDELLGQMAGDVAEAAKLQAVAVALPDQEGWRIAAATGGVAGPGDRLAGSMPDQPAFWASSSQDLAGFRAAIRLTLADRPLSLLLLGDRRDGEPLSEIDLRYVTLFLAPLSGMIGYAQCRERQRQAESAIAGLYDRIGELNLAVLNQSGRTWGQDEVHLPLRLIVAQAGQLLDGAFGVLDPVQRRRIELIHRHAQRLERAIADTADLTALLDGTAVITRLDVDVRTVVQRAWDQVRQQAELKAVRLVVTDRVDGRLRSDPERLTRLVGHLLDNAVTHSPTGGDVVCRWGLAEGRLTLAIIDTGPGIPPDRLYVLQALPTALENPDSHPQGRLGIGLALVHATVRRLGGDVRVESLSRGTTVTVSLPVDQA
jgi:signal transduction histidine kinase